MTGEPRISCPDESCGFVHWNNPIPVVAMIVETEAGVVLAHNVSWPREFYSVITGFLEAGEDPRDCAIRETKEELNLDAKSCELIGVYPFAQQNQVIIGYAISATGDIVLNEELDDYKVIRAEKLKPWNMGTGLVIEDWLKQRTSKNNHV